MMDTPRRFTWDEAKRRAVLERRGVDFIDAVQIFEGPVFVREDTRFDYGEKRYLAVGETAKGTFIVIYAPRDEGTFHVVTAWAGGDATRRRYQKPDR